MQQLTIGRDGIVWVDLVPQYPETSYTHQNTNITARTTGLDNTTVLISGTDIVVKQGGVVDVNGVPFVTTEDNVFPLSSFVAEADSYLKIIDGVSATEKVLAIETTAPIWNSAKNYYETAAGDRVLNKFISIMDDAKLYISIQPMIGLTDTPSEQSKIATSFYFGFFSDDETLISSVYTGKLIKKPTGELLIDLSDFSVPFSATYVGEDVNIILTDATGTILTDTVWPRLLSFNLPDYTSLGSIGLNFYTVTFGQSPLGGKIEAKFSKIDGAAISVREVLEYSATLTRSFKRSFHTF